MFSIVFTLIKQASVYSPSPLGVQDILIADDKIAAIEKDLNITGLPDLKVVEGKGKIAVPGLVDGHVHLIGGGGEGGFATRTPEAKMTDMIKAGITTVVGLLGIDGTTRQVTSLYAKTKGLNIEGISAYMFTGGYPVPSPQATGSIHQDILLMDKVIGVKTALNDHRSSHPDLQELKRLASDARTAGLLSGKAGCIVVHMGGGKGEFSLLNDLVDTSDIPIRQFIPTHVNRKEALYEAALDWCKRGGFIDLTAGINPERGARGSVKVSEAIARAIRDDLPLERLCVSSDANGSVPVFNDEGLLTGIGVAGFDPMLSELTDTIQREKISLDLALQPFTTSAATSLGLEKEKGKLGKEREADLLLLDGDMNLHDVFAKGQHMYSDGLSLVHGVFD
ncbi:MAG: beta-aspartyl-peptidase [Sneathiellales bacterium]|nr:beta-aspartyl-peptidase [Sneathiellales bacterium]